MSIDVEVDFNAGRVRPLPVLLTTVDVAVIQGYGKLAGWSFRDGLTDIPLAKSGNVVAPAAGATIATTGALAAGTYLVNWSVQLDGAAAAADENNFQIFNGVSPVLKSINPGAAGLYQQVQVEMIVAAGATIAVKSVGAGTAAVGYTVDFSIIPQQPLQSVVELQDNAYILGEWSSGIGSNNTVWMGRDGVEFRGQINVHVVSGAVIGTLYVVYDTP